MILWIIYVICIVIWLITTASGLLQVARARKEKKRVSADVFSASGVCVAPFLICNWIYFFQVHGVGFGLINLFGGCLVILGLILLIVFTGSGGEIPITLSGSLILCSLVFLFINGGYLMQAISLGFYAGFVLAFIYSLASSAIYLIKLPTKRIEEKLTEAVHPITTENLLVLLHVSPFKEEAVLNRARKIAVTTDVNKDTYIFGNREFNILTQKISNFLLTSGNRDIFDLQNEVTGTSTAGFFIAKSLRKLIDDKLVVEIEIGSNPDIKDSPEGYAYAHVNKPMPTNAKPPNYDDALDMDDD